MKIGRRSIVIESSYNFNEKQLRGCNFELLPFIRVFPPAYTRDTWTLHFGWLVWTVMVHAIESIDFSRGEKGKYAR